MLNLTIVMRPERAFLVVVFFLMVGGALQPWPARAQENSPEIGLNNPTAGAALQGLVTFSGRSATAGFSSAAIYFGYPNDPTQTWFVIAENIPPIEDGTLATWDTFQISDGIYNLLLVVVLQDQSKLTSLVEGVRVRNYNPIETNTPTAVPSPTPSPTFDLTQAFQPSSTPTPTLEPSSTPTPTPMPPNPARLEVPQVGWALLVGAGGSGLIFILIGIYLSIRRIARR